MKRTTEPIDKAARWAVRLDAGPLKPEEQQALDDWLATSTRHRGALVRARAVWADMDRVAALSHTSPAAVPALRKFRGVHHWRAAAAVVAVAAIAGIGYLLNAQ